MNPEISKLMAAICLVCLFVVAWCGGATALVLRRGGLPRWLPVLVLLAATGVEIYFVSVLWTVAALSVVLVALPVVLIGCAAGLWAEGFS